MPGKIGLDNAPDASAVSGSPLALTGIAAYGTAISLNGNQLISYDAANQTGLRNGTTAQVLSVYNTYTAGTPDYERLEINWAATANTCVIRTASNGTGTARTLRLDISASTGAGITIGTTISNGVIINSTNAASGSGSGSRLVVASGATCLKTAGTWNTILANEGFSPTATSTCAFTGVQIAPTINFSNGTPGAGYVYGIYINPTNTALPTGVSAAIAFSSTCGALGGVRHLNTADETTNYEHFTEKWSSNIFQYAMAVGGTGTYRNIAWQINDPAAQSVLLTNSTSLITGAVTDGYCGSWRFSPTYNAGSALTVTRHNYIDINNLTLGGAGPAAVTDACVFRFNAAAGTHKAVDAGTTKTSPGTVTQWIKVNVNGTIAYIPSYSSKTS